MAIANLFVNALEAMPGGGLITFRIYCAEGGVGVDISDSGLGIQEHLANQLFKPFSQPKKQGPVLDSGQPRKLSKRIMGAGLG